MGNKRTKKSISLEGFVFLAIFLGIFGGMGMKMGGVNMLNTLMNTGYQLLLETVFYIMAIAVLSGALFGLQTDSCRSHFRTVLRIRCHFDGE